MFTHINRRPITARASRLSKRVHRAKHFGFEPLEDRRCLSVVSLLDPVGPESGLGYMTIPLLSGDYPVEIAGVLGNEVYFAADVGRTDGGKALLKSDGTVDGTVLVKGFFSNLHGFTSCNGQLFFINNGNELWKTDGSTLGTVRVKSIAAEELTSVDNVLYFIGNDGIHGRELWKSDGTAAGTVLVKDINPGAAHGAVTLASVGGQLFFAGNDGIHGSELWKSDSTPQGTQMVADLRPGVADSFPGEITGGTGTAYFTAFTNGKRQLWRSDGTTVGTVLLYVDNCDQPLWDAQNSILYFRGLDGLWQSDGTIAGTLHVPDAVVSNMLGVVNGTLIFHNNSGLWSYSSDAGLQQLCNVDFNELGFEGDALRASAVVTGGKLYVPQFVHVTNFFSSPLALWVTDGTPAGTTQLNDIVESFDDFVVALAGVNGTLLFTRHDHHGHELWKTDGTPNGTSLVVDTLAESWALVAATDGVYALRGTAHKTDGTVSGTVQLPGQLSAPPFYPTSPVTVGGTSFYAASGGLTYTDGTVAGTEKLRNLTGPFHLTGFQGEALFSADAGDGNGTELWKSDGTSEGTILVKDINPGPASSGLSGSFNQNRGHFAELQGNVYFGANDGAHGFELWRSDGTETGTILFKDLLPGIASSQLYEITRVGSGANDRLFFVAQGVQLWASDGTEQGTTLVKDFGNVNNPATGLCYLVDADGRLFFMADDGDHGLELWTSDGTPSGTHLVKDIAPGQASPWNWFVGGNDGASSFAVGNLLYFYAKDNAHGLELWRSDGTEAGTYMVKDINPGPGNGRNNTYELLQYPAVKDEVIYFAAVDGVHGSELWRSDGTEAGTYLVDDIIPGPVGGHPRDFVQQGGNIYFTADDGETGRRVFKWLDDTDPLVHPQVNALIGGGNIAVARDGGDLVVTQGATELLRRALGTIADVTIIGTADSEVFEVTVDGLAKAYLPDGIIIAAGEGASDNDDLVLLGSQTVTNWNYTTGGPESGTIAIDGLTVTFSEFEPIFDHLTVVNRTFQIGTPGGQTIVLDDDGNASNGIAALHDGATGSFESIYFTAPSARLVIKGGDGDDTIILAEADAGLTAALRVEGEAGNDTIDAVDWTLPVTLSGGLGNDSISGGSANDILDGGPGADQLDSGPGIDVISAADPQDQVISDGSEPLTIVEGTLFEVAVAAPGTSSATVDWGDGTCEPAGVGDDGKIHATHTYRDNGAFQVSVTDNVSDSEIAVMVITVNNVAPSLGAITAPFAPQANNIAVNISSLFADVGAADTHTAVWNWGDGTSSAGTVVETNGSGSTAGSHAYAEPGVYTVKLTVRDDDGGFAVATFQYVVVYDPSAGFVSGGGWIDSPAGAYVPDPNLTGKANFGFVSRYKKGQSIPDGQTQFQFKTGNLAFESTSYEWLVIAGANAKFKGEGTINGQGRYGFILTATDGQANGGGGR